MLNGLLSHLSKDAPEYTALLGLLAVAVIANMPHPETITALLGLSKPAQWLGVGYKWGYDSLQAFMAARNPRQNETHIQTSQQTANTSLTQDVVLTSTPNPTPPGGNPAKTK